MWGIAVADRQHLQSQTKQEGDRLNSIFYRLLKQENGRVAVWQLAMEVHISSEAATDALDLQPKDFQSTFYVGEPGEIYSIFDS